jgi:transglutaminase-like putative cysteine protease
MSRLYFSEQGRVISTLCEELTFFRRARKRLELPATAAPATLYLLARSHTGNCLPLRVAVNGAELPPMSPKPATAYLWYDLPVDPALLVRGPNVLDFWTDATSMTAWSLGLELGPDRSHSVVSDDGGRHYRSEGLGYLSAGCGDYVVRVRLADGEDPAPRTFVWEEPDHPRLRRLREIVPPAARASGATLDRTRALATWLASSWEHTSSGRAAQYTPWDAETILEWGRRREGHDGRRPIAMCVHYAVTFASCCQAIGIAARCWAFSGALDGADGHFAAEVWLPEMEKWALVDPNMDAVFVDDGVPLSTGEVRALGERLGDAIQWGPGFAAQRANPHLERWLRESYLTGRCFRHRALWPRADFLAHPEAAPPGHGSTAYCETALVWDRADRDRGFGMFPFFADDSDREAPPGDYRS